jgi:hypothetical protein
MRRYRPDIPDTLQLFTWATIRSKQAPTRSPNQLTHRAGKFEAADSAGSQQTVFDTRCFVNVNDQGNSVSPKEHLLALLAAEREMANQQKTFIDLRFELAERALELDHVEMLRRLDRLNHAHEDARQKEASFVGREVYDTQTKENNKWRDDVNASLSTRQGRSSVTSGVAGAVGGLALSGLFAMIMYLAKAVLSGFQK